MSTHSSYQTQFVNTVKLIESRDFIWLQRGAILGEWIRSLGAGQLFDTDPNNESKHSSSSTFSGIFKLFLVVAPLVAVSVFSQASFAETNSRSHQPDELDVYIEDLSEFSIPKPPGPKPTTVNFQHGKLEPLPVTPTEFDVMELRTSFREVQHGAMDQLGKYMEDFDEHYRNP